MKVEVGKSSITYVNGDLFSSPDRMIAHGCNAQGVMGSGVAKIIRDKFPGAFDLYRKEFETNGLCLGQVVMFKTGDKFIANLITQDKYGGFNADGSRVVNVDYQACHNAFEYMISYAAQRGIRGISIPKIGAGLGGGDWNLVEESLKNALSLFPHLSMNITVWEI